jgi:hypothetical protein
MSLTGSSSSSRSLSPNGNVKKGVPKKRGPQVRHPRGEASCLVGTRGAKLILNTHRMGKPVQRQSILDTSGVQKPPSERALPETQHAQLPGREPGPILRIMLDSKKAKSLID